MIPRMMMPLGKKQAVGILEENGKETQDAEAYYDFMVEHGYKLVRDGEGLIAVPQGVQFLEEAYMTDAKDEGCFIHRNAPELSSQGVPQGKG